MDDWSLILLSCKVALEGKNTGEQVIRKGDPGNYAYIVLTGAVKVCPLTYTVLLYYGSKLLVLADVLL